MGMGMDDKSGEVQRRQSGTTDCFCFTARISSQKPNRESLCGLFWEVELTRCGDRDRAAPAATAPGAAAPLCPKLILTGFGGVFVRRGQRTDTAGSLEKKTSGNGVFGTLQPAVILSPCANGEDASIRG